MNGDRCPLRLVAWDWPDNPDAEARVPLPPQPCDAQLHLVWHCDIPIEAGDKIELGTAAWANTDSWEVVCENGHTLANSSGEENAEPFVWDVVFGENETQ